MQAGKLQTHYVHNKMPVFRYTKRANAVESAHVQNQRVHVPLAARLLDQT